MVKIQRGQLMRWAVAAMVIGLVAWSFRPQPVAVDLMSVSRGQLRVTIDEEGMTRVRERYVVSAPVAGRMQRVELHPGDRVEANRTVLATFLPATPTPLDPRSRAESQARLKAAQTAREQARVALQRARDEQAFSRSELARYRQIEAFGGVTEERLSALQLQVKTTEAQVAAAGLALQTTEAEVEAAAAVLRQFGNAATGAPAAIVLRSPINGAILRVHQESEALVAAGTPLIEVGDPGDLEVVVDLLSTDAVKVKPGLRVVISGWGGAETLGGRVRLVEPGGFTKISALGVEEQRVNIVADLDDPRQASPLGDAYRVDVSVIVWERSGILKVPTSALFRAGDKWSVFAARDGVARQTAIQVGQRNALEAEVLAGLSEHDLVIVHPGEAVADGVRIIQRE